MLFSYLKKNTTKTKNMRERCSWGSVQFKEENHHYHTPLKIKWIINEVNSASTGKFRIHKFTFIWIEEVKKVGFRIFWGQFRIAQLSLFAMIVVDWNSIYENFLDFRRILIKDMLTIVEKGLKEIFDFFPFSRLCSLIEKSYIQRRKFML
jgi:hypothetical protein